jgi:hypothetical protein
MKTHKKQELSSFIISTFSNPNLKKWKFGFSLCCYKWF